MPFETTWEPDGVVIRFRGEVTEEEMLQVNLELYRDPRFPDLRFQVADFSAVDGRQVTAATVRKLAEIDRAAGLENRDMRVALVLNGQAQAALGSVYEFEIADSPWQTEMFDSLVAARGWVHLAPHT